MQNLLIYDWKEGQMSALGIALENKEVFSLTPLRLVFSTVCLCSNQARQMLISALNLIRENAMWFRLQYEHSWSAGLICTLWISKSFVKPKYFFQHCMSCIWNFTVYNIPGSGDGFAWIFLMKSMLGTVWLRHSQKNHDPDSFRN